MATIVIADDEPSLLTLLARVVSMHLPSAQVITAVEGLAALHYCLDHLVDLVITDQAMPGLTGLELADCLAGLPNRPRIVLTSGTFDEDRIQSSNVDLFLPKPWSIGDIRRVLDALL